MKNMLKVIKWAAILAGVVAIPYLLKKRSESVNGKSVNIRYDINDYISEAGL